MDGGGGRDAGVTPKCGVGVEGGASDARTVIIDSRELERESNESVMVLRFRFGG